MLVEKRTGHDPHNTFSHGTVQGYSNVIIISVGHGQLKVIAVLVCKKRKTDNKLVKVDVCLLCSSISKTANIVLDAKTLHWEERMSRVS